MDDILDRWEEAKEAGIELTPEELCLEHPELIESVRWEIEALERVDKYLDLKNTSGLRLSKSPEAEFVPPNLIKVSGQFQLIGLHASGGLGQVYLARDNSLNRTVAIKFPKRTGMSNEQLMRFEREAKITGQLEHPGIVPIYAMQWEPSNEPCYVMRYIDGVTLDETVRDALAKPLAENAAPGDNYYFGEELRRLLRSIVSLGNIVAYAHQKGVIHRDLKPANIMLGPFGETILLDWGIAKELPHESSNQSANATVNSSVQPCIDDKYLNAAVTIVSDSAFPSEKVESPLFTSKGQLLGTPAFASPEQILSRYDEISIQSDIFSLGSTLYYVLRGQSPIESFGWNDYMAQLTSPDTILTTLLPSHVPPGLRAICTKAMRIRPADRYESASDFVRDLDRYLAREPISVMNEPVSSRIARWSRKRPALVGASIATIGVAFLVLAFASTLLSAKNRELSEGNAKLSIALADLEKTNKLADETLRSVFDNVTATRLATQSKLTENDKRFLETSLKQYLEFADLQHDSEQSLAIRAEAHLQSGNIHVELSQASDASFHLSKAISLFEELICKNDASIHRVNLADAYSTLANLQMKTNQVDESVATAKKGLAILEPVDTKTEDRDSKESTALRLSRANILKSLGGTYEISGRLKEAIDAYEKSREMLETLLKADTDNTYIKKSLASCYRSLGDLLGDFSTTSDEVGKEMLYADRAIELFKELVDHDPTERSYPYGLSWAYYDRGHVNARKENLELAMEDVGKAITIIESLRQEYPLIEDYDVAFRMMHLRRARLAANNGRFREAAADIRSLEPGMVRSAEDVSFCVYALRKLNKEFPKQVEYEVFLIDMLRQEAAWFEATKNYQSAEQDYEEGFVWCELVLERLDIHPIVESRMVLCLIDLSRIHALQGQSEKAKSELAQARSKAASIQQLAPQESDLLAKAFEQYDHLFHP